MFAANAFSLLGLRQLFFLIDGLLDRLVYLAYGLAVILGFIGAKLVIHALHTNELPFVNGGRARDGDPGDPDLALAGRHPRHAAGHHGGQPGEEPPGPCSLDPAPGRAPGDLPPGPVHAIPDRSDDVVGRTCRGIRAPLIHRLPFPAPAGGGSPHHRSTPSVQRLWPRAGPGHRP